MLYFGQGGGRGHRRRAAGGGRGWRVRVLAGGAIDVSTIVTSLPFPNRAVSRTGTLRFLSEIDCALPYDDQLI